jgi:hypothetical protein
VLQILHTYIVGFGGVCVWRGVWYLWDVYDGISIKSGWISHAVGIIGLLMLRALRSILAPPAASLMDGREDSYTCSRWDLLSNYAKKSRNKSDSLNLSNLSTENE